MDEHTSPTFAQLFESLIQSRGLSQRATAMLLGVSDSQVSRWRRGIGGINLDSVEKIAEAFGQDRDTLARLAGLRDNSPASTTAPVDPEIDAIMDADRAELRDEMRDIPSIFWPAILQARRLATKAATEIARLAVGQPFSNPAGGPISTPHSQPRPTGGRPPRRPGRDKTILFDFSPVT